MRNLQPVRFGVLTLTLVACGFVINGCAKEEEISSVVLCEKNVPARPFFGKFTCSKPAFKSKEYIVGEPYTAEHVITVKKTDQDVAEYRYAGEFPIPCHWRPLSLTKELGEEISTTHTMNVSGTAQADGLVSTEVEAGLKLALAESARTEARALVEPTTGDSLQSSVKIISTTIIPVHVCTRFTRDVEWDVIHHQSRQPHGYRLTWESECKFSNPDLDEEVAILSQTTECWTGEYVAKANGHGGTTEVISAMAIQQPCVMDCPP